MNILLSGGTGYLGAYALAFMAERTQARFRLLVRAESDEAAEEKLWRAMQLHWRGERFREERKRIDILRADFAEHALALNPKDRDLLQSEPHAILHCAATLNRRSESACLRVNQRGTLNLLNLAQELAERGHLGRFTYVSTVAVAGERQSEVVEEDSAIDWKRRDYDPYARSKKFCESLLESMLAGHDYAIVRPSIVLGDSRFGQTTQFDMARAFVALAETPWLPLDPRTRLDICNADYVGAALAAIHLADSLEAQRFHLSAGRNSPRIGELVQSLASSMERKPARFSPRLAEATGRLVDGLSHYLPRPVNPRALRLFSAFWPYLTNDTVFANERVRNSFGLEPTPFADYAFALYDFARRNHFRYPYRPLPPEDLKRAA